MDIDKKFNKFLQELSWHDQCNKQQGDICKHPHCRYSVLNMEANKSIYFTCGRSKMTIKILEFNKQNKNNTIISEDFVQCMK